MPRKRMIDPNFWRDEKIASCSYMERLLFEGLWTFAEDSGAGRANPKLLKSDIFPYDNLRESVIADSLIKFSKLGMIQLYEKNGQRYYFVCNFKNYQTINRPTPSTFPLPDAQNLLTEDSLSAHGGLTEDSLPNISKDNIREDKRKEVKFTPPTFENIKAYCEERKSDVDPQKFYDYFTTGEWKDSEGKPVKNWKQKLLTWEGRGNGRNTGVVKESPKRDWGLKY